jgi:hypothetical protein
MLSKSNRWRRRRKSIEDDQNKCNSSRVTTPHTTKIQQYYITSKTVETERKTYWPQNVCHIFPP